MNTRIDVDVVDATNRLSALQEIRRCVADYSECLSIHLDAPTSATRTLLRLADIQLRISVLELPL